MNIEVAKETKHQLHEVIGMLVLADIPDDLIDMAKRRLIATVKGLEIVINNDETKEVPQ